MSRPSFQTIFSYDESTLIHMYETLSPEIYRYAMRLLGSQDAAEDCVSETFSRFLYGLKNGNRPDHNQRAYLYRIAHNWVVDYYRSAAPASEPLEPDYLPDASLNPSYLFAQAQEIEGVRAALRSLTPEQQIVIQLRFLEDYSHEEVAAVLGKTAEATRALQYRALAALRQNLSEQEKSYAE